MCWVGGGAGHPCGSLQRSRKVSGCPGTLALCAWAAGPLCAALTAVLLTVALWHSGRAKNEAQCSAAAKTRNWPKIFMGSSPRVVRVTRDPLVPAPTRTPSTRPCAQSKSVQLLFFSCVFSGLRQMSHTFGVTSGFPASREMSCCSWKFCLVFQWHK